MRKAISIIEKIIFAAVYIISCLTTNSDKLSGYWGKHSTSYTYIRLILIFTVLFILTLINNKNSRFISVFCPVTLNIITAVMIFDNYVTGFGGTQLYDKIWWFVSIYAANAAVFLALTIYNPKDYNKFYRNFLYGLTPIYIFTFIICFLRSPFVIGRSVNTELFNGTFRMFRAFIAYPESDPYLLLLFLGNLLIFIPVSFLLFNSFKKAKSIHVILIGIMIPLFVEGYQYIFSCGNVDIDDLILNWFGFLVGFVLQRIINKKLLNQKR